jgi:ABC-type glycerol-3-phosphate transport system substrate-binding protein
MHRRHLWLLLVTTLLLGACGRVASSPEVRGQIIVWHAWEGARAETLDALLDRFAEIYPDATIVRSKTPPGQLISRFRARAAMGLGPDLLVVPGEQVALLASEGYIQDLTGYGLDTSALYSTSLVTAQHNERLYGLPLALDTMVLYYNREMVETPATTLEELLAEAMAGRGLAMPTDFHSSFWGIKAFGGDLIDAEGRIVLDQGGLANWLGWLKIAQGNEEVFFKDDGLSARQLFEGGRVAYYVGSTDELLGLREVMGVDPVGVAPLPAGPFRHAGPLLNSQVMVLNASSSAGQSELALRLARFLTGAEQQAKLARQASTIPANAQVRVDARLNPGTAVFLAQVQTAVPLPNLPQVRAVLAQGDMAYTLALEGVLGVAEVAEKLSAKVNEAHGLTSVNGGDAPCPLEGPLRIWHAWQGDDLQVLRQVSQGFMRSCPGVYVISRKLPAEELLARYMQALAEGDAPDLVIGRSNWIAPLSEQGLLVELDPLVPPDMAQRFVPSAWQAASPDGQLYGLPVSLCLTGLYYDAEQVANPAPTLPDLLREAREGRAVALPTRFPWVLWGASAFGGMTPDSEHHPSLEAEGLAAWLDWLRLANGAPGMMLTSDMGALLEAFMSGEAAYLVAEASLLPDLLAALGPERLRTAPLPTGPAGESLAFLTVDLVFLSPLASAQAAEAALAYGMRLTGTDAQQALMAHAARVPANVSVATGDHPAIVGLMGQAKSVVVSRAYADDVALWRQGAALLEGWLAGDSAAQAEMDWFVDAVGGRAEPRSIPVEQEEAEQVSPREGAPE